MRFFAGVFVVLGFLFGSWATDMPAADVALAQEATAEAIELTEGVTLRVVGVGMAEELPPAPATIAIYRVQFEPGASFAVPGDDPDTGVFVVESGTLTFNSTAPITVLRAAGTGEEVAADTDVTLDAGDSFLSPAKSGGEFRNDGDEPVILLIAAVEVIPAEEAVAATPAA